MGGIHGGSLLVHARQRSASSGQPHFASSTPLRLIGLQEADLAHSGDQAGDAAPIPATGTKAIYITAETGRSSLNSGHRGLQAAAGFWLTQSGGHAHFGQSRAAFVPAAGRLGCNGTSLLVSPAPRPAVQRLRPLASQAPLNERTSHSYFGRLGVSS